MNSASDNPGRAGRWARALLLWLVFLGICLGLGYPVLNRFDPRQVKAVSDSIDYAALVEGPVAHAPKSHRPYRVLVPLIARPFAGWVAAHYPTWNPTAAGMLASNALFMASTLLMLVYLALYSGLGAAEALLAAFCLATNFIVVNLYLVGLVDSAELCAATMLYLGLVLRRTGFVLLAGVIGGLGKETFVLLGPLAAGVYWLTSTRPHARGYRQLAAAVGSAALALSCVVLVRWWCGAQTVNPFALAQSMDAQRSWLDKFLDCCFSLHFFYGLYWLLPVALWGLGSIPRPLRYAAISGGAAALALGVYHDARAGNVARPIFSYAGPILCLAAGVVLARVVRALAPAASG